MKDTMSNGPKSGRAAGASAVSEAVAPTSDAAFCHDRPLRGMNESPMRQLASTLVGLFLVLMPIWGAALVGWLLAVVYLGQGEITVGLFAALLLPAPGACYLAISLKGTAGVVMTLLYYLIGVPIALLAGILVSAMNTPGCCY